MFVLLGGKSENDCSRQHQVVAKFNKQRPRGKGGFGDFLDDPKTLQFVAHVAESVLNTAFTHASYSGIELLFENGVLVCGALSMTARCRAPGNREGQHGVAPLP
eukprot:6492652-Amphidinium_carterae.4